MKYEIHVTVATNDSEQFRVDCEDNYLKPIIIQTENSGEFGYQVMTSSKYEGVLYRETLANLVLKLEKLGYEILRQKVEIFPTKTKHPDFIYYETHFRLKLPKNYDRSALELLCNQTCLHLSKNIFKRTEEFDYQMVTYRSYDVRTLEHFLSIIEGIQYNLSTLRIKYDKVEIEECILDSNESIDNNWLIKKENSLLETEEVHDIKT